MSRIIPLDGLRGLCIVLVLVHNMYPYGRAGESVLSALTGLLANSGWMGVQWFFVLSGYLITRLLLGTDNTPANYSAFYMRRALRIFPIYYLSLVLIVFVLPVLGYTPDWVNTTVANQNWFWIYINNWLPAAGIGNMGLPHFWSLAVEEQFYLFWPLVIIAGGWRRSLIVCLLLIISAPLARLIILNSDVEQVDLMAYVLTIVRWDALAWGSLLALLMREPSVWLRVKKYYSVLGAVALLFIVIWLFIEHSFAAVAEPRSFLNQTMAAVVGLILIKECVQPSHHCFKRFQRLFENSILVYLGTISYGIYLYHMLIQFTFYDIFNGVLPQLGSKGVGAAFIVFGLKCALTIVLAALSWLLIERPLLSLKRYFPIKPKSLKVSICVE